jgi:hypothetical protein
MADSLSKALDRAIAAENKRQEALLKAHPDACPNCLEVGGDKCWLCDSKAEWNQEADGG